jgi:hypothetical protein
MAIDLRANNLTNEAAQQVAAELQAAVGDEYDVIFESYPEDQTRNHIHLEYDPN